MAQTDNRSFLRETAAATAATAGDLATTAWRVLQPEEDDAMTTSTSSNNNNNNNSDHFTPHQELVLHWTGRIAAVLSLLGGLYICYGAWKRRDHVYHRLMFALSIYIVLWSPWMIYGTAALPVGTPDVLGAFGNTATCTAQGIVNQLSTAVPSYYVALSGVSWIVVVCGQFDPSKHAWVEKHIHFWVNLWAIVSSVLLASMQAFNPSEGSSSCWIGALPMGCGGTSGIPCTRGPQNISQILAVGVGLPAIVLLLVPTLTMVALVCFLLRREHHTTTPYRCWSGTTKRNSGITAWAVTKQSMVYLGTLYWIYVPGLLSRSSVGTVVGDQKRFVLCCIGNAITLSMGVWYALAYRYFSSVAEGTGILVRRGSKRLDGRLQAAATSTKRTLGDIDDNDDDDTVTHNDAPVTVVGVTRDPTNNNTVPNDEPQPQQQEPPHELDNKESSCTFTIFDGTAPSHSPFSEFIFDGDDEDEEYDIETTKYWAGCQGAT